MTTDHLVQPLGRASWISPERAEAQARRLNAALFPLQADHMVTNELASRGGSPALRRTARISAESLGNAEPHGRQDPPREHPPGIPEHPPSPENPRQCGSNRGDRTMQQCSYRSGTIIRREVGTRALLPDTR